MVMQYLPMIFYLMQMQKKRKKSEYQNIIVQCGHVPFAMISTAFLHKIKKFFNLVATITVGTETFN